MKPFTIRLTEGQADRLAAAAQEAGISRAAFVRRALSSAVALQAAGGPIAVTSSPFPGPHRLRLVVDVVPEDCDLAVKEAVATRNAAVIDGQCRCGARAVVDGVPPPLVGTPPGAPTFRPGVSRPPIVEAKSALQTATRRPQIPRQVVQAHIDHHPACPANFRPLGGPA